MCGQRENELRNTTEDIEGVKMRPDVWSAREWTGEHDGKLKWNIYASRTILTNVLYTLL